MPADVYSLRQIIRALRALCWGMRTLQLTWEHERGFGVRQNEIALSQEQGLIMIHLVYIFIWKDCHRESAQASSGSLCVDPCKAFVTGLIFQLRSGANINHTNRRKSCDTKHIIKQAPKRQRPFHLIVNRISTERLGINSQIHDNPLTSVHVWSFADVWSFLKTILLIFCQDLSSLLVVTTCHD